MKKRANYGLVPKDVSPQRSSIGIYICTGLIGVVSKGISGFGD